MPGRLNSGVRRMDSRAVMMRQRTVVLVEVMEVPVTWIGDQSSTRAEL